MTTATHTRTDLDALLGEFISVLDAKERERRVEVNERHFAEYGRLLYPEGSTYCTYVAEAGRRFIRIVQVLTDGGSRSVHCFVDRANGDVLKAAGWSRAAQGARFNLVDSDSRTACFDRCDFAGGYLYARAAV